jgi:hypothetical protein
MKKLLGFGLVVLFILASCEKDQNEVFFKISDGKEYKIRDIQLYDTSTHILYLKKGHAELTEIMKGAFTFLDDGAIIYEGSFMPGYSSSIPNGPFIMSPSMYGDYALKIENGRLNNPDIRNDSRMINLLNKHDLLHSGLAITSSSLEIAGTQLTFKLTVTNQDQSDLLILDLVKTGPNLFHYFTNGLSMYDSDHNEVFSSTIQHLAPDPWNSFKTDWLSELKSGDSKEYIINYTINNQIMPGEYNIRFSFPGLAYQVAKDQLFQGSSRIWLGGIDFRQKITIH